MNELIIENFKKLINLIINDNLQLNDKINNFRIKSLKKVISIISKLNFEIKSSEDIKGIPGIGKSSILRIDEIINTGLLEDLKNYDKIIKKNQSKEKIINELTNVIGIGRIVANNLINTYKIKSVDELKKLSNSNPNLPLINEKIKLGLKYLGKFEGSIPRSEIDKIYDYLQKITDKFNSNMFVTICGSYRRELPTSSDIDILLVNMNLITMEDVLNYKTNLLVEYVDYLHKENFLVDDITDKNIKTKYMGFGKGKAFNKIRRIDIRLIPMVSYFPALLYFTGSYEHNQKMRLHAKKLGFKLNEYGLYDLRTTKMIVVTSEQEIFEKLEMNYLMPNQR